MALSKAIPTASGYNATYWKIRLTTRVNDGSPKSASVELQGFKDAEARQNGNAPMASRAYQIVTSDIDALPGDDLESQIYAYLKTLPDWATATDI